MSYKNKLKKMQKSFNDAKENFGDAFGVEVPAGIYVVKMTRFEMGETSNDTLAVFREQVVSEGEQKGNSIRDMFPIESDFGMKKLLYFLDQAGVEVKDLNPEDLEEICTEIEAEELEYKAKLTYSKNGNFPNLEVMEIFEGEVEPEAEPEEEASEDAKEEEEELDYDDMDIDELKELCEEREIKMPKKAKRKILVKLLEEDDEAEPEEEATEEEDSLTEKLIEFASVRGIDVKDDMTKEAVIEILKEYDYEVDEMDSDEIELFKEAGIDNLISGLKKPAKRSKK